jgi:DNA-binding NtrC family response regulator
VSQSSLRIILVEDHADSAESLRKFLFFTGAMVYIAPDIASARALAKSIPFDVLVSDLELPDGNGWDLMRELTSERPVTAIAISGHNRLEDVTQSRHVGFIEHISKPLSLEKLKAALQRAKEAKLAREPKAQIDRGVRLAAASSPSAHFSSD